MRSQLEMGNMLLETTGNKTFIIELQKNLMNCVLMFYKMSNS